MRAIVTDIGKDKYGIIAKVSQKLLDYNINILDITQTIMQGDLFTMILLADISKMNCPFEVLKDGLKELGDSLDLSIRVQREEIFQAMHRI